MPEDESKEYNERQISLCYLSDCDVAKNQASCCSELYVYPNITTYSRPLCSTLHLLHPVQHTVLHSGNETTKVAQRHQEWG